MNLSITELPDYEVAFVRRIGSYFEQQNHWEKLMEWAAGNGLYPPYQHFIGISLDNPNLVESHLCRHDACVTLPDGFEKEKHKDVLFRKLAGGPYALYSFYGNPETLNEAYHHLYQQLLPASAYTPDFGRHTLEFNLNNPAEDPEGKCKVNLYVPIKNNQN